MSVKIPKDFINELLSQTNIVELIKTRINLNKKGKNYQTNCPFHQDKTPSFTVSDEKQFYYCFGCNAHGNAIDFLINYDHLSFLESIEELAINNSMIVPFQKINNHEYVNKQKIYMLMENMSKIYQKNILLTNTALEYLQNRGISKNMIDMFSIGFSSLDWNYFSKKFNIHDNDQKELIKYNIIGIKNKKYVYDPFRGRITFPIHNKNGKIIGFGGRTIYNVIPKYLNSSENNIFQKRKEIYGLYHIIKNHIKPEYLLVVEGYIDVITLTQNKINYVVSSLGTSTTKEHIQLLFRYTNTIIYCYDGDNAGRNASWNALKISLPYISDIKTLKFILLPKNEDPDTIIKKEGQKKFQKRIKNALNISKFFFKNILKNINLSSTDEKFSLSTNALPLINSISSDIIRLYFRQILARKIGILDDNQFEKFLYENKNKKKEFKITSTPMRILIGLLIQNPSLAKVVPIKINFNNIQIKGLSIFLDILKTCIKYPNINTGQLLELYRDTKIIHILKILSKWDHMIVPKEINNMFLDLLTNINNQILEKRQEYLISKERIMGLKIEEKKEIWNINKILSKKK